MSIIFPLGYDLFSKIREEGLYYVDKTEFISELLKQKFEVSLITRPRRFGKTLTMSMLADFFDIGIDSKAHFEGLKISNDAELCDKWMNQWPVIFLSLKSVEGNDFGTAYERLELLLSELFRKYDFIAKSGRVNQADQVDFIAIRDMRSSMPKTANSLSLLTRMLHAYYGREVILLIDEYDVPLAKADAEGYYKEMLDVIRSMLGAVLKTNLHLKFAVLTGCLKISKESIFTGLNNIVVNTITSERYDDSIGFTESDVGRLLADAGFEDHASEVKAWYDGYRFGSEDIYCPWDVLNHVAALQVNASAAPGNYWAATSHNDIIYKLFENRQFDVNSKFETLMAGEYIIEVITEELTYDLIDASEENLWSLLFMTGYLTLAKDADIEEMPSQTRIRDSCVVREKRAALRIPNEEVKLIFKRAIIDWFRKNVQTVDRKELFQALWQGDTEKASEDISDLMFNTISYHDYAESYYHAFVAGLFAGAGYIVESNYEYGDGRPDVVIKDKRGRRVLLFEVKHTDKGETLEHACQEALKQIRDRRYAEALEGYRIVIAYGIAFKGKDCRIEQFVELQV